jgi:hypothetical protein
MAVDYLKTYLGIDPDDYSAMEARIRGEEPQAQAPVMMRQPIMMPQRRSLSDIEAMPSMPRVQIQPQVDDRYQSLMDEIASLKAQIDALQTPVVEEAPMMPIEPEVAEAPMMPSAPSVTVEQLQNRMVGEPQRLPQEPVPFVAQEPVPFVAQEPVPAPTPAPVIPQAPSQDIQSSIDYLAKLPKMNIPQIPDVEEIKRKIVEANLTLPTPISYEEQLQEIRDLPKITQMPTREEIQTAMQNIPTSVSANVTQNPFQKINDIIKPTVEGFQQAVASKPNPFVPQEIPKTPTTGSGIFGNLLSRVQKPNQMPQQKSSGIFGNLSNLVKKEIQQPQMQSYGRPSLPISRGFMPEMRASGGGIDKAIYDLKFKLNGR